MMCRRGEAATLALPTSVQATTHSDGQTTHRVGRQQRKPSMKSVQGIPLTILPVALAVSLSAAPARADLITDWNVTANEVMTTENTGNNPRARSLAMVHVAMSDAVNSVQNRYTRVVARMDLAPGASAEAAANAAARQILLGLYPKQKEKIDSAYAAALKGIGEGPATAAGIALG